MKTQGVILLFFDLPVLTASERHNYQHFVKNIKKEGFVSLQKSIYIKQIGNIKTKQQDIRKISNMSPSEGTIYALTLSQDQFARMNIILGEKPNIKFDHILVISNE